MVEALLIIGALGGNLLGLLVLRRINLKIKEVDMKADLLLDMMELMDERVTSLEDEVDEKKGD